MSGYLGWPADKVLRLRGRGLRAEVVNREDPHPGGRWIVKWYYPECVLTMAYRKQGRITCYRVIKHERR